jgi:hypothetical protein
VIAILQAEKELRMIGMANKDNMNEPEICKQSECFAHHSQKYQRKAKWPRTRPFA